MLSISLVPSRTASAPTALVRRDDGREFYLHSRYDPLEEAAFLAREVVAQERTLYVVLGFGLGYHVRAILDHVPRSSHVIVVEPDAVCLSGRHADMADHPATAWVRDARLHFLAHHDPRLTPVHLADRLASLRLLSLKLVTHVPSTLTAEEFYRSVASEIPRHFPENIQRHLRTLDASLDNELRNFWANLPYSWNATPIERLRGIWFERPIIVVAGGPSLNEHLPRLQRIRDRALVLAMGSTVKMLHEHGIRPDLVISVDPYEPNVSHFTGNDVSRIPLVYYHRIHRGIVPAFADRRSAFVMQDEPDLPLIETRSPSPFWRGGTVAFSALQLAHYMDANPIIFVGQDFAFASGHTHAIGAQHSTSYDEANLPHDYLRVPSVDGQTVVTSLIFEAYRLHMQEYLLNVAKRRPTIRHVNTSRTGAAIRGMASQSLEEAVAEYPVSSGTPAALLAEAFEQKPRIAASLKHAAVDRWIEEIERILDKPSSSADFDALFHELRRTSLYAQIPRSYEDVYYVFEAEYGSGASPSSGSFVRRFIEHLRHVATDLRDTRAVL